MNKKTYGDVKAELSRVGGQTGMKIDDARLRNLVDLAQERLCALGEWPYQYARIKVRAFGGILSFPSQYEAAVHLNLNGVPLDIRNPWYEFLEFGPGSVPQTEWVNASIDLGESPVYRQPGSSGAVVRAVSTEGADTGNVVITGYDVDGVSRTATLALPDASSTIEWSKITWVKKPVTLGDVVLSYTDGNGTEYQAAAYLPRDTNPNFRQYRMPGIGDCATNCIEAIVRRRLFPILADADELFIPSVSALRLGIIAIGLEDKGGFESIGAAAQTFKLAAGVLAQESAKYRPQTKTQVQVNVCRVNPLSGRSDIY